MNEIYIYFFYFIAISSECYNVTLWILCRKSDCNGIDCISNWHITL